MYSRKDKEPSDHDLKIDIIEREIISGEDNPPLESQLTMMISSYDHIMLVDDVELWHDKDSVRTENQLFDIEPCPEMAHRLQRLFSLNGSIICIHDCKQCRRCF